jgi:hypothetical protein
LLQYLLDRYNLSIQWIRFDLLHLYSLLFLLDQYIQLVQFHRTHQYRLSHQYHRLILFYQYNQ